MKGTQATTKEESKAKEINDCPDKLVSKHIQQSFSSMYPHTMTIYINLKIRHKNEG